MSADTAGPDKPGEQGKSPKGPSNLLSRVLTAAVLVPVIVLLIFWKRYEGWWALVFLASAVGAYELIHMSVPDAKVPDYVVGILAALSLGSAISICPHPAAMPLVGAAAVMTLMLYVMFWPRDMAKAGWRVAGFALCLAYAGFLFPFVALLKRLPHGSAWVMLLCTVTWLGDTGAYFVGRFLGRHKLYPAVSPKKTWEGALGGMAASIAAGVFARCFYMPELSWLDVFFLTIPASMLGQAGDFCESLLKRSFGVKDSGQILPGHGGILDRVDALVFISPYLYFYAVMILG